MDFHSHSNATTNSDGQIYPSSSASSTRFILGSPSASAAAIITSPTIHHHQDISSNNNNNNQQQQLRRSLRVHHQQQPDSSRLRLGPFQLQANVTTSYNNGGGGLNQNHHSPTSANITPISILSPSYSMGALHNAAQHRASDDSDSTNTNLSTRSAPPVHPYEAGSQRSGGSTVKHSRKRTTNLHETNYQYQYGYLKISPYMADELYKYRRMLCLLLLAMVYAMFAFTTAIIKSPPSGVSHPSGSSSHSLADDWTQELIAGWHRDRPLHLGQLPDQLTGGGGGSHSLMRVRECRSRTKHHQKQVASSSQLPSSTTTTSRQPSRSEKQLDEKSSNTTTITSTQKPSIVPRKKHKFEALNGCLFRRDSVSESMGDICCCAGIPRYRLVPEVIAHNQTAAAANKTLAQNNSTTRAPNKASSRLVGGNQTTTTTERPKMKRKYLRPQILCFVSAAANLFNSQRLVAPLANEANLRNTFDKGQCITCSCCHEHEPEKVNKLLANVPLYVGSRPKSMMVDRNGNQLMTPANGDADELEDEGFWVRMRQRLIGAMRSLDEFFFWFYELLEQSLMIARYGIYPANFTDSGGLLLIQGAILRPTTFEGPTTSPALPVGAFRHNKHAADHSLPSLFIDEDTYDDFTTTTTTTTTSTTTTTTTTSTTTAKPMRHIKGFRHNSTLATASKRLKATERRGEQRKKLNKNRKQQGRVMRRRKLKSTATPSSTSSSTTTSTTTSVAPTQIVANISTTSTTKSPTVIINVYAGGNSAQAEATKSTPAPTTTTSSTTTTTIPPTIVLASGKPAAIMFIAQESSGKGKLLGGGGSQGDIELRIELDKKDVNISKATVTAAATAFNSSSQSQQATDRKLQDRKTTASTQAPSFVANLEVANLEAANKMQQANSNGDKWVHGGSSKPATAAAATTTSGQVLRYKLGAADIPPNNLLSSTSSAGPINSANDTLHASQSNHRQGNSNMNEVASQQQQQQQTLSSPSDGDKAKLEASSGEPSKSSIVISLGEGNSTTIIRFSKEEVQPKGASATTSTTSTTTVKPSAVAQLPASGGLINLRPPTNDALVSVGAGGGSLEPSVRQVVAVGPSAAIISSPAAHIMAASDVTIEPHGVPRTKEGEFASTKLILEPSSSSSATASAAANIGGGAEVAVKSPSDKQQERAAAGKPLIRRQATAIESTKPFQVEPIDWATATTK